MNHKTHLDQLIAEGDFGRAIKELLAAVRQNGQNSLYNDLIILSGRYNQQETAKLQGIISDDTYRIGMAKISQALIHYLDKYRPDGKFKFEPLPPPDDKGGQNETRLSAVFISYSRQDSPLAERIKQYLESESLPVIMDVTHLGAGENIQAFIEKSIRESRATLSLVSSRSLLSIWVANESMNSFYAGRLGDQKFIPVFEDNSFLLRSFVDDALDKIEQEIKDISSRIKKRLDRGIPANELQGELDRYRFLMQNLPAIVHRLREHLSIDISADNFETGMQKIIAAIRS
ncbi:MAG: TIR domain-containing protein [Saprospiraceae bacterium]